MACGRGREQHEVWESLEETKRGLFNCIHSIFSIVFIMICVNISQTEISLAMADFTYSENVLWGRLGGSDG